MPERPVPPLPPKPPLPPMPGASSPGEVKVPRPAGDLSPKFKAGAKLGGLFMVLVIIGASISDISKQLGLDLPTILTSGLGILATLGAVYKRAGDGR